MQQTRANRGYSTKNPLSIYPLYSTLYTLLIPQHDHIGKEPDMTSTTAHCSSYSRDIVTIELLLDWLSDFHVEAFPADSLRTLSWITAAHGNAFPEPFPESEVAHLVNSDNVELVMKEHPLCLGLLVLHHNEPFSEGNLPFDRTITRRLIVVRENSTSRPTRSLELLSRLQSLFFKAYQWNKDMQDLVKKSATLQELVDTAENVLGNYIDVSDATYSLVAYTKNIEAPDTLSKELQALGCHSKLRIDYAEKEAIFDSWRSQKGVRVFEPDEISPHPYMTKVLREQDEYRGHVVMVCNNIPPTRGSLSLFSTFASYCESLILKQTPFGPKQSHPAQGFLEKLITDPRCPQSYIDNQLLILDMARDSEFQVAAIDFKDSSYSDNMPFLLGEIKKMLPRCIAFSFGGLIVLLFHGENFERDVAENDRQDLKRYCIRYKCTAFFSDRFHNIRHIRFAHQQALFARKYRSFIDIELRPLDNIDQRRLFSFEEAFGFYCYENGTDDEFGSFCTSHTILDEMAAEETHHDVCDLKLLYCYLFNERKATPTATQLHMHRNNVLYRIRSIEKRYGLDLDQFEARQRLLNCYRIKIMTSWQFRDMLSS